MSAKHSGVSGNTTPGTPHGRPGPALFEPHLCYHTIMVRWAHQSQMPGSVALMSSRIGEESDVPRLAIFSC